MFKSITFLFFVGAIVVASLYVGYTHYNNKTTTPCDADSTSTCIDTLQADSMSVDTMHCYNK